MNGKGRINKTLLQVYEENNKLTRQEEGSKYVKNTVDRCPIRLIQLIIYTKIFISPVISINIINSLMLP